MFHDVDFPYTHDLQELLALCSEHGGWPAEVRPARKLTYYAISARYPGEADEVSLKEASDAVKLARLVRDAVRSALAKEGFRNNSR